MRVYNLFVIKKEYYDIYMKRPELLFEILENLYHMDHSFNYGITLFEQLCNKISIDAIRYYLNNRYGISYFKNMSLLDGNIDLRYSRIIVESQYNFPSILKIFYRYSKTIFVCDFINQDYFFLDHFIKAKALQSV